MSAWKIVVPHAASNYVRNPSAETTGNYTAYLGSTVTRSTDYSARGEYSYKIVPGGAGRGVTLNTSTDLNGIQVYVLFYARDVVNGSLVIDSGGSTYATTRVQIIGSDWYLYISEVANDIGVDFAIYNTANETWYLDCVMVTLAVSGDNPAQTYLDGDQPGCAWSGGNHSSFSTRPVTTRAGGIVYDLLDDYGLHIESIAGDMTRPLNIISERPFRAGGSVDVTRIGTRVLILVGWLITNNVLPLHAQHVALTDILRPDAVPVASDGRPQPVVLQYWGTEKVLQLRAHYGGGLDEMQDAKDCGNQRYPLTFDVVEPYWEEVIERAVDVTTEKTGTARFVMGRIEGEWGVMGPPASMGVHRGYGIRAIAETPKYVYFGGDFEDFDAAGQDLLVRYNKETGAWDTPYAVAPPAPPRAVFSLLVLPDGRLVAAGDIDNIDAVPIDNIGVYNEATATWAMFGDGLAGVARVSDLAIDTITGDVYAATPLQVYVLPYPYVTWAAFGDPTPATIRYIEFVNNSSSRSTWLYAGGDTGLYRVDIRAAVPKWLTIDGPTRITALESTGTEIYTGGMGDQGFGVVWDSTVQKNGHPKYNALAAVGAAECVFAIAYDDNTGYIYITGDFTELGYLDNADACAVYKGGIFYNMEITLPLEGGVKLASHAFHVGLDQSVSIGPVYPWLPPRPVQDNVNLYVGFNTVGAAIWPGGITAVTANVPGGAESKPILRLTRTGGTSARIESVRNRTTGDEIRLNLDLNDGESIYIDLVSLRVYSDYNNLQRSITPLPGSRFASFSLLPTGNQIDVRVVNDGATIDGTLRYIQRHHSYRSANVAE